MGWQDTAGSDYYGEIRPSLLLPGKEPGTAENSARLWVQDELKEVILYGIVVEACIFLIQHLWDVKAAWFWRTMRKFHG